MPEPDNAPGGRAPKHVPSAKRSKIAGSTKRYHSSGRAKQCFSRGGAQWTDEAEEEFLDCFAASGNVLWSSEQAGVGHAAAYRQRRQRADFAVQWDGALDQAYARLEFEYVNAAIDSLTLKKFNPERPIPRMTVDQVARALWLYRSAKQNGTRRGGPRARPKDLEELRESILKKVRAIKNAPKPD